VAIAHTESKTTLTNALSPMPMIAVFMVFSFAEVRAYTGTIRSALQANQQMLKWLCAGIRNE
jgi:hypothetical protein